MKGQMTSNEILRHALHIERELSTRPQPLLLGGLVRHALLDRFFRLHGGPIQSP
jgi:hypothetical protein